MKGSDAPLWVFTVRQNGNEFDVLSLLSPEDVSASGIPPLAQVGQIRRRAQQRDGIYPEDFRPNAAFLDLLHNTIATYGPQVDELQTQAREIEQGLVYVVDKRSRKPSHEVPMEDIFGSFRATEGKLIIGSYNRNDSYRLLTANGFFQLQDELRGRLLEQVKNARD